MFTRDHHKESWTWRATDLGYCPKKENSQKWIGEGAIGLLDAVSQRALAPVCAGAIEVLGGAKDSWETCAPSVRPLHPPLTAFGDFPCSGSFPGPQLPKAGLNLGRFF